MLEVFFSCGESEIPAQLTNEKVIALIRFDGQKRNEFSQIGSINFRLIKCWLYFDFSQEI